MKILFYCIWGLWSVIILLTIKFNHYAEFFLEPYHVELLFNEYTKQWALINAGITLVWILLTCIGLHLIYKKDEPSFNL